MENIEPPKLEALRHATVFDEPAGPDLAIPKHALTPPTSEDMERRERSSSELSECEGDHNVEEDIEPDHYYGGGRVPVFKPTMEQFRSFKKFIEKVDKYGMKSGIIKVIPPKEWCDSLPALDDAVKRIKVKNPITQEFSGAHGKYTQANIEKQRSYNLPQWKALTEESNHQPPARRGERRRNQEIVARGKAARRQVSPSAHDAPKRKPGRPRKFKAFRETGTPDLGGEENDANTSGQVPPTPTSVKSEIGGRRKLNGHESAEAIQDSINNTPVKSRGRQPKSVSSRRKYNRKEAAEEVDEEAFKNFDYRLSNLDEFTPDRCQELEVAYWKSLTFAPPMYGADMPGSLFDERTSSWNVAKLENLLDVLGTKVPGVNTAYLYLGMWKATFAWHLEDVDLYSINYIHFGAPKQWYSISQEDARRFEAAMKSVWTSDAKNCDQFLRHKTYLISPQLLQSQFNIRVNKLVHNEGEFVITFPYGYHSGYNLGYNCAESVNFATEAWLDYGRIAKKCDCEADSVWVDVAEIERKLHGEDLFEQFEETDIDDDDGDLQADLPSPPSSLKSEAKRTRKRKRQPGTKPSVEHKTKRVKIRIRIPAAEPCLLCPNDVVFDELLPTDNDKKAHRLCALYTPETFLTEENGKEKVCNIRGIDKARLELKCNFCRSKRGACFQCAQRKCTRAFHATCAVAAGVQIDAGLVPTYDENGTEYSCEGYDLRCRYHRPKRPKTASAESLENDSVLLNYAKSLQAKDTVQVQYLGGDIFGGVVVENRPTERSIIIDVLPDGDRIEVEWKYLICLNPRDSQRPKPSRNAKPLPHHMNNKRSINLNHRHETNPAIDEPFADPAAPQRWAEFNHATEIRNSSQAKVDFNKSNQLWFYLGDISTEAKAKFTENRSLKRHNAASVFLDTVKPALPPVPLSMKRKSFPASYPSGANIHALNGAMATQRQQNKQWKPPQSTTHTSSSSLGRQIYRHDARCTNGPFTYSTPNKTPKHGDSITIRGQTSYNSKETSVTDSQLSQRMYKDYYAPNRPLYSKIIESRVKANESSAGCAENRHLSYPYSQLPLIDAKVYGSVASQNSYLRPSESSGYPPPGPKYMPPSVAPIAKMIASDKPSMNYIEPDKPNEAQNYGSMSQPEFLTYIQRYPYLRNSYLRRPKTYQSPYAADGGISKDYIKAVEVERKQGLQGLQVIAPALPDISASFIPPTGAENMQTQDSHLFSKLYASSRTNTSPLPSTTTSYLPQKGNEEMLSHGEIYNGRGINSNSNLRKLIEQLGGAHDELQSDRNRQGINEPAAPKVSSSVSTSFKPTDTTTVISIASPVRPDASPLSDIVNPVSPGDQGNTFGLSSK